MGWVPCVMLCGLYYMVLVLTLTFCCLYLWVMVFSSGIVLYLIRLFMCVGFVLSLLQLYVCLIKRALLVLLIWRGDCYCLVAVVLCLVWWVLCLLVFGFSCLLG